ncbi:hypothetical protein [Agaribacterium sp. ZY112]|uniref:hypothetical protein n=1 Tax=Agaribacterium sp. ZY112 TaxID=3233574 RepID=UPI00352406F9
MLELAGYTLIALLCFPVVLYLSMLFFGAIFHPIGKAMDYLHRHKLGRVILSPIIFVCAGAQIMWIFPSLIAGAIFGVFAVYVLLWSREDKNDPEC